MDNVSLIPLILGMTAVTYLPRLAPFLCFSKLKISPFMDGFLKTIPVYAVFIQTPGKVKSILGLSTIIYTFLEPFNISPKAYFASYEYNT